MAEYGSANFDRRQYPRLDADIPVAYEVSDQKLPDGITANISLGGLMVLLPHEVHRGDVLELTMRLPTEGEERAFRVRAEVVWAENVQTEGDYICRAGLRFFEMSPKSFQVWKSFLDTWYNK